MSKSAGNGIGVDEIIDGVYQLTQGYRFCDKNGQTIDYKSLCVWRKGNDFFTAKRFGLIPVFLCTL